MGFLKKTITALSFAAGGYIGVSSALASGLIKTTRVRPEDTPESVGLDFQDVSFTSRGGDADLSGWLIQPQPEPGSSSGSESGAEHGPDAPGVRAGSGARGISWVAMVHGDNTNRGDSKTGMLDIARALSRRGFGIFMFDMRARGDSPAANSSSGYYERLDLQGASGSGEQRR